MIYLIILKVPNYYIHKKFPVYANLINFEEYMKPVVRIEICLIPNKGKKLNGFFT
jgi:hypothetical protein